MKLKIKQTKKIRGEITISGSKNGVLPILAVSILTKDKIKLTNVPDIVDVDYMTKLLKSIGIKVLRNTTTGEVILKRRKLISKIKSPYLNKIRASYYLIGALFSEKRTIQTKMPGGCNFEERPIDYHFDALKKMNAKITIKDKNIKIKRTKKLPATITLKTKSLGATINIILASVKTKGQTIINNPSLEPEVLDLINILNKMNANIIIQDSKIIITGVKKLKGTTHKIIPDRIEAGSYMILAGAVEESNLLIKNVDITSLTKVIELLKSLNLNIYKEGNNLRIIKNKQLSGTKIVADNYPLFPTDLQQPLVSMLLSSGDISMVKDNIYQNRFSEVCELLQMNGKLYLKNNSLLVFPSKLLGTTVYANDLRAGFSLIVAGCIADGDTIIEHSEVILRGYSDLIAKLSNILVDIEII